MKKETKTMIVWMICLLVPLGALIGFYLYKNPAVMNKLTGSATPATKKYVVGTDGNPTDAEDASLSRFNTYILAGFLKMTPADFYALNPDLKNVEFVNYGTSVNFN